MGSFSLIVLLTRKTQTPSLPTLRLAMCQARPKIFHFDNLGSSQLLVVFEKQTDPKHRDLEN